MIFLIASDLTDGYCTGAVTWLTRLTSADNAFDIIFIVELWIVAREQVITK
jgi:hypothetical protein